MEVESIKAGLQQSDDMYTSRALDLLGHALKSNKMVGLSAHEQLLFAFVKSTKVFQTLYSVNPHKVLFMLLTGRSGNWWDKNHMRMLHSIGEQPLW